MVELLYRQLRHRWLYLHALDSFAGLESLIRKYFAAFDEWRPIGAGDASPANRFCTPRLPPPYGSCHEAGESVSPPK